jgi:pyridoxamine 5'-phosphate oxidase
MILRGKMLSPDQRELINSSPICSFATIDGQHPRVRLFWTWFLDDEGIYFHTPKTGDAYQQMVLNRNVEMCYSQEIMPGKVKMLRISGSVIFIDDNDLREKLLADRPFLKELGKNADPKDVYGMFMLRNDEIQVKEM